MTTAKSDNNEARNKRADLARLRRRRISILSVFLGPTIKWLTAVYIVVVAAMVVASTVFRPQLMEMGVIDPSFEETSTEAMARLEDRLNDLETRHQELSRTLVIPNIVQLEERVEKIDAALEGIELEDPTKFFVAIKSVRQRLDNVDNKVVDLQEALDPTAPIEILTLARLGDQVNLFQQQVNRLDVDIQSTKLALTGQMDRDSQRTTRELDRILNIFMGFGLLLIPVFLKFFADLFGWGRGKTG